MLFFLFPPLVEAATVNHGTYDSSSHAQTACNNFRNGLSALEKSQSGGCSNNVGYWAFTHLLYPGGNYTGTDIERFNYSSGCAVGAEPDSTGLCVVPPDCGSKAGEDVGNVKYQSGQNGCIDGCRVVTGGVGICLEGYACIGGGKFSGESCTATDPVSQETPTGCASMGGQTICADAGEKNCGEVNGVTMCADSAPSGNCTFLPGGSYICDSNAPNDLTHQPVDETGKKIGKTGYITNSETGKSSSFWTAAAMSGAANGTAANSSGGTVGECVGSTCGSATGAESTAGGGSFGAGDTGQYADEAGAIAEARVALSDTLSRVRSEAAEYFSGGLGASPGLPCFDSIVVLGSEFSLCLTAYSDGMQRLGMAIMFIAFLLSAYIILR